jgi:hypothetical protein
MMSQAELIFCGKNRPLGAETGNPRGKLDDRGPGVAIAEQGRATHGGSKAPEWL